MQKRINSTSEAILSLIHGYLTKKKKSWALISQVWMLETLEKFYGIKIARSTLNYNLAKLRSQGLIASIKRHKKSTQGVLICRITLYKLTNKTRHFFCRMAAYLRNIGWKRLKRKTPTTPGKAMNEQTQAEKEVFITQEDIKTFIGTLPDESGNCCLGSV